MSLVFKLTCICNHFEESLIINLRSIVHVIDLYHRVFNFLLLRLRNIISNIYFNYHLFWRTYVFEPIFKYYKLCILDSLIKCLSDCFTGYKWVNYGTNRTQNPWARYLAEFKDGIGKSVKIDEVNCSLLCIRFF